MAIQRMREGVASSEAEDVRNDHIKHEASVKAVGFLYLLGASFMLFASLMFFFGFTQAAPRGDGLVGAGFGVVMLLIGLLQLAVGLGLRRLKSWARVIAGVFSGIGLLGFPFGTIINAYILYLLLSAKGRMVFSDEYQDIIAKTPEIKYRTSIVVWIVLGVLILLILGSVAIALFGFRP
jgi:hypothetical protein